MIHKFAGVPQSSRLRSGAKKQTSAGRHRPAELEKGNSVVTGRVVARAVYSLLLFIHRGPREMVNAGSGGVGGRTTALNPQISSTRSVTCQGGPVQNGRGTANCYYINSYREIRVASLLLL